MRLKFENVYDDEVFPYPVVLLRASICGISNNNNSNNKKMEVTVSVSVSSDERLDCDQDVQTARLDRRGKFKCLLHLWPGRNRVTVTGYKSSSAASIYLTFNPDLAPERKIRLFYVVCRDSDGHFQGPEEEEDCGVESARKRISLAAMLVQCFLGQSLLGQGRLKRKSVSFEPTEQSEDGRTAPRCAVFRSSMSEAEVRAMGEEELWKRHAEELLAAHGSKDKFLAVLAATRYEYSGDGERAPETHKEILAMTRAHAAVGGGGLALFGSGGLHTWPESMDQVMSRFGDDTKLDWTRFMDDSAFR